MGFRIFDLGRVFKKSALRKFFSYHYESWPFNSGHYDTRQQIVVNSRCIVNSPAKKKRDMIKYSVDSR